MVCSFVVLIAKSMIPYLAGESEMVLSALDRAMGYTHTNFKDHFAFHLLIS